jgi:hypothetical protein
LLGKKLKQPIGPMLPARRPLIRQAISEHLKYLEIRQVEERDRQGYIEHPPDEFGTWEEFAVWPAE